MSNKKNHTEKRTEGMNAIELAILNGIEAYNREQERKQQAGKTAQARPQTNQPKETARSKGSNAEVRPKTVSQGTERKGKRSSEKSTRNRSSGTPLKRADGATVIASERSEMPSARPNGNEILRAKLSEKPSETSSAQGGPEAPSSGKRVRGKTSEAHEPDKRKKKKTPVKVLFFGGVGEIGKNMTALEYGNDIIVIDAGVIFPTEEMPGIDLVFPDITYLVQNKEKIRGVFLTHGHEDHIGGVPYLMKEIDPKTPVYGTKLTLALTDNKLREHKLSHIHLITVSPGEKIKAGIFSVNLVNVNHSIAGALALAIETPYGVVFHSGDYKIDLTPVAGKPIDLAEIAEYGRKGVLLYLGESTNIERPGYTMSETVVGTTLEHLFSENIDRRLIIATFASNVHRLQQIIDIAVKFRRKVALSGRSMLNVVEAALKIGELTIPEGVLVDVEKVKNYFDREIVIVSTGSQGEPMSALTRMASGEFNKITIGSNDTIIISASPIPGNERMIYRVINNLFKLGANVVYESLEKIHVSGHACQEEHKIMHTLLKPKFFIPVHGEYRHLKRHALLAEELGMSPDRILIPDIGCCALLTDDSLTRGESFPSGARLLDGEGFEDLGGSEVLKDRLRMSEEGVIIVSAAVSGGILLTEPVIEPRGVVFSDEKSDLKGIRETVLKAFENNRKLSAQELSAAVKRALRSELFKKMKQSPMIIVLVTES